jgi:L-glutamine-phosphate cytidylyltransferase
MNAIIIAAGSGKRISNKIRNTPKALIEINNKTIIQYQIDALKKMNIDKIIVITGPNYEKFNLKDVQYINDKNYEKHDILGSLIEARDYIKNDVLVLYSDIIFEPKIIGDVLDSKSNISIAVDMNWEEKYQNRTEHPTTEAENVLLDERKNIFQIRKNIQGEANRIGEFLGILKFSAEGAKIFVSKYDELMRKNVGEFHEASTILKAYITDMLQELIDSKINIEPVFISGKWCEIDTMQDLKIAEKIF